MAAINFFSNMATGVSLFSKPLKLLNGVWDTQFKAPLCPELIPPVIHYSKEASSPWKTVWDFLIPSHRKGVVISIRTVVYRCVSHTTFDRDGLGIYHQLSIKVVGKGVSLNDGIEIQNPLKNTFKSGEGHEILDGLLTSTPVSCDQGK